MVINDLIEYGGSKRLAETMAALGIKELYPPQALAIEAGLLQGQKSFMIAAPIASGKTLIAEMAALNVFFRSGEKVVYLVPTRPLAREKYEDFSRKYEDTGVRIAQSTIDYDSADPWLGDTDLIIATYEKMDSLMRHRAPWLKAVNFIIADDIQFLGDLRRGPAFEIIFTRLKRTAPELRLLALSSSIANASEIAQWLNIHLIESSWRPVPLKEGVYFNGSITFDDGSVVKVKEENPIEVINLSLETIKDGGQALIFVNTRRAAEFVARKASSTIIQFLSEQEKESLKRLSGQIIEVSLEPTRPCKKLAEYVSSGVAFHHSGVIPLQRKFVEDAFRTHKIKLMIATLTLAMGLDLPSRRVIIRDWWRYEPDFGIKPIPVIEIRQMAGEAGRPGIDKYGEAIFIARNEKGKKYLMENYITRGPERVDSQLAHEFALRSHILAAIAGTSIRTREELMDFLKSTFSAYQKGADLLISMANRIVDFLRNEGLISERMNLVVTEFGRRISELYIDPLTSVAIRDGLLQPGKKGAFVLLHLIAHTPDMVTLRLRRKDYEHTVDLFQIYTDELLIPKKEIYLSERILSELKTAFILLQWIEEIPENKIVSQFEIGPGDLSKLVTFSDWLLYSAGEISKIYGLRETEKQINLLRIRIFYGIKEELLPLVSLKGIGRVRARNLYNAGYKTLREIKSATIEGLTKIPGIGKGIAEDIKRQTQGVKRG